MLPRHLVARFAPCARRRVAFTEAPRWARSIANDTAPTAANLPPSPVDFGKPRELTTEQNDQPKSEESAGLGPGAESRAATELTEVDLFHIRDRIRHTTSQYGADVTPHYEPSSTLNDPPRPSDITLELLLASQCHMGHSTSLWNPANSRYIFGIRQGIHIISLDTTAAHLRRAAKVVSGVAKRGGIILFAGTRRGFDRAVIKAAELAGGCHLFERWIPGTITNGQQILGRCVMVVVDENDRQITGFEEQLGERRVLKPDLVVCLNPLENYIMLHECALANIPTIGIVDTDVNPTWVTYPIPANDDSLRSVELIAGILGRAGEEGQQLRKSAAKRGEVLHGPPLGLEVDRREDESNDEKNRRGEKGGSDDRPIAGEESYVQGTTSESSTAQVGGANSRLSNMARDESELEEEIIYDEVASEDVPRSSKRQAARVEEEDERSSSNLR